MKGLYVYGALLMALSFAAGVVQGYPGLCALAIASCALAALCEAIAEYANQTYTDIPQRLVDFQRFVALSSWGATAAAALFAIVSLS